MFFKYQSIPDIHELVEQVEHMFIAFHSHLRLYESQRICQCGACSSATKLTLKFVVHAGDMELITIKEQRKPYGSDVILAHRLLKNDIPANEYLLLTDSFLNRFSAKARAKLAFEKAVASYDQFGDVPINYMVLSHLHEQVETPPPIQDGTRTKNPWTRQIQLDAPVDDVAELIMNFDYRTLWNKAVIRIDYDKDKINRVGTSHACVFDSRPDTNLETVTSDFGANKVVYGERTSFPNILKEMTIYFIMEGDESGTTVRAEAHPIPHIPLGWLAMPFLKPKLMKNLEESLMLIKAAAGHFREKAKVNQSTS